MIGNCCNWQAYLRAQSLFVSSSFVNQRDRTQESEKQNLRSKLEGIFLFVVRYGMKLKGEGHHLGKIARF